MLMYEVINRLDNNPRSRFKSGWKSIVDLTTDMPHSLFQFEALPFVIKHFF